MEHTIAYSKNLPTINGILTFLLTWVQWQSSWPCPANPRLRDATSNHLPAYLAGSKFLTVMPLIIISIPFPSSLSKGRISLLSAAIASWHILPWERFVAVACSIKIKFGKRCSFRWMICFSHFLNWNIRSIYDNIDLIKLISFFQHYHKHCRQTCSHSKIKRLFSLNVVTQYKSRKEDVGLKPSS